MYYGYTIRPGDRLQSGTLRGYVHSAVLLLGQYAVQHFNIQDPRNPKNLHPWISEPILLRAKWQKPLERREPYTDRMIRVLYKQVHQSMKYHYNYRYCLPARVLDLTILGSFTGHRGNESVQTVGTHTTVSRVPRGATSGDEAGNPLAFMAADWSFYDAHGHLLVGENLRLIRPSMLDVTYRFDKTKENFKSRKYWTTGHHIFDPVIAAWRITIVAMDLNVDPKDPLAVFTDHKSQRYKYITSKDVIDVMRRACVAAYPDPTHYLRLHINSIVSHSNRVTACVALGAAGKNDDEIGWYIRWSPPSVRIYRRDACQALGPDFIQAILKAHGIS